MAINWSGSVSSIQHQEHEPQVRVLPDRPDMEMTRLQQACNFQWLWPLIISWSTSFIPAPRAGGPELIWDVRCLRVFRTWCLVSYFVSVSKSQERPDGNRCWRTKVGFYISPVDSWLQIILQLWGQKCVDTVLSISWSLNKLACATHELRRPP